MGSQLAEATVQRRHTVERPAEPTPDYFLAVLLQNHRGLMLLPPMTKRPPHEDEGQLALWRRKPATGPRDFDSVVVAHADISVGESIALLLRLKGFAAIAVQAMEDLDLMLEHWKPRVLLIDTRLCHADDFRFVRHAANDPAFSCVLLVAMTNIFPEEAASNIRQIGFDGLFRRPCPVWRLADLLDGLFHP
ncbi:response regulator receiver protein [Paraburkholderia sp. SIMBA_050]